MIGEIRDTETAEIAIQSALTGHLVLSTLHTNDAPSAITRLVDMGIEPFLASSSLLMVLAQRLVRRICEECKEPIEIAPDVLERSQLHIPEGADVPIFYHGKGCDKCGNLGYKGRMSVVEVLDITESIKALIIKQATAGEIKRVAIKEGMKTLRMNALQKAIDGFWRVRERHAQNPYSLARVAEHAPDTATVNVLAIVQDLVILIRHPTEELKYPVVGGDLSGHERTPCRPGERRVSGLQIAVDARMDQVSQIGQITCLDPRANQVKRRSVQGDHKYLSRLVSLTGVHR